MPPITACPDLKRYQLLAAGQLGPADEQTLLASFHLANALRAIGRTSEARVLNEQTLRIQRDVLGADDETTLATANNQPEGLSAGSQGDAQTTRNGDQFIGWGALPYFSEFSPSGQLLFNAEFPAGVNTYRAYRLPWPAHTGQRR